MTGSVTAVLAWLDSDAHKYLDYLPCLCFVCSDQGYLNTAAEESVPQGASQIFISLCEV